MNIKLLNQLLSAAVFLFGISYTSQAALITATYQISADNFADSNFNPPNSPTSTSVSGTVTFTFDTTLGAESGITPDNVTGFDITDNNGNVHDYNETDSGVNTELNIFTDSGRLTYGGNFNSPAFMVGLSEDFRVIWDINLTTFEVTSVVSDLSFVTTVDAFYDGPTTITLLSVSPALVPIGPAAPLFLSGAALLGLMSTRRKHITVKR